ncbi:hypothetical protein [Umezawaea sp.]|uniref:hypothetical protein n=1 Tax=Umezawaea sp. TaxID=1955258 RepID=UPI002ED2EC7D
MRTNAQRGLLEESTAPPPPRFPVRLRGYDPRSVHGELAAIEAETLAARAKHEEAVLRIRAAAAELGRVHATLHEYEWLHAENPTREPLACYVRHLVYVATREARSIEEDGRARARATAERGERTLAARRAELAEAHREGVRRLEDAARQAARLVDATVRDVADLAGALAHLRAASTAGAGS